MDEESAPKAFLFRGVISGFLSVYSVCSVGNPSFCSYDRRRLPDVGIAGWFEIAFTEFGNGVFAAIVGSQMARRIGAGEALSTDLFLQRHQAVEQCLGARRAAGNVDVDRDVAIDALEHVVTLLERAAGNRT